MGIINSLRFKGAELSSLARQMQRGLDKEGRSKHQKGSQSNQPKLFM